MALSDNLIQKGIITGYVVLIGISIYLSYKKENKKVEHAKKLQVIVVFSGKRKSGKDYITDRLLERINNMTSNSEVKCNIGRLSAPLKKAYAEENNLDYAQLLSDGPYKEKYRLDMIPWGENKRKQDASYFAKLVMKDNVATDILIISDARRKTDLSFFKSLSTTQNSSFKCISIRVEASVEARKSRGYQYTEGIDDADSECGLDHVSAGGGWDFVVRNDKGDPTMKQIPENDLSEQIDSIACEIIKQHASI